MKCEPLLGGMVRPPDEESVAAEKRACYSQLLKGVGHAVPRSATRHSTKHLTCMDSGDPSFGQNDSPSILPITAPERDDSLTAQGMPETMTDAQALHAEQFHLLEQNGQPIQYDPQSLRESNAQMEWRK